MISNCYFLFRAMEEIKRIVLSVTKKGGLENYDRLKEE